MRLRFPTLLQAFLSVILGAAVTIQATSLSLVWDPSPDAAIPGRISGYKLYYAFSPFTNAPAPGATNIFSIALGNQTNAVVSNLVAGQTYYFAVTSVDADGLESDLSNIASYLVPADPVPGLPELPPDPGVPGGPGGSAYTGPPPGSTTGSTTTGSTTSGAPTGDPDAPRQASLIGLLPRLGPYQTNGHALLAIAGTVGATFEIQRSPNPFDPFSWTTVTTLKLTNKAPNANPLPGTALEKAFVPALEAWQDPEPLGPPNFYRIIMPLGYPILADEVLRPQGYNTRLVAVRLPGIDAYIVCYVTEEGAYLDYNGQTYLVKLESSGATIREIATQVSSSLSQNWTSASEFIVEDGLKQIVATVVKTDPPELDPPIGTVQSSGIAIDF